MQLNLQGVKIIGFPGISLRILFSFFFSNLFFGTKQNSQLIPKLEKFHLNYRPYFLLIVKENIVIFTFTVALILPNSQHAILKEPLTVKFPLQPHSDIWWQRQQLTNSRNCNCAMWQKKVILNVTEIVFLKWPFTVRGLATVSSIVAPF
jgi:hypothetical protein